MKEWEKLLEEWENDKLANTVDCDGELVDDIWVTGMYWEAIHEGKTTYKTLRFKENASLDDIFNRVSGSLLTEGKSVKEQISAGTIIYLNEDFEPGDVYWGDKELDKYAKIQPKERPWVLKCWDKNGKAVILPLTSRATTARRHQNYSDSPFRFYKIRDLQPAGLPMQSWVALHRLRYATEDELKQHFIRKSGRFSDYDLGRI